MPEMTLFKDTAIKVVGRGYLSSDHISTATGLDPAITISKNGGNFANPNAGASVMTEIESTGWYYFALAAEDTDTLGPLIIRGTHATMDNIEVVYQVVADTIGTPSDLGSGATIAANLVDIETQTQNASDMANILITMIDGGGEFAYYWKEVALAEAPSSDNVRAYLCGYKSTGNNDIYASVQASTLPASVTGDSTFVDANWDGYGNDWCVGWVLMTQQGNRVYTVTDFDDSTDTVTIDGVFVAADEESPYVLVPWGPSGGGGDVTLADGSITAAKFDGLTAFPLTAEDANSTYIARTGADSDTLETLSDQLDGVSSQISAIGSGTGAALNYEVTEDNASSPIKTVTAVGSQTGTYANTLANDGTTHQVASVTNQIDWVYGFDVGAARAASKVVLRANMSQTGDTVTVSAYNFSSPGWDVRTTISGTPETLYDIPLFAGHTGTGADEGKVYVRFQYSEGDAGTLVIDEAYVQAQQSGSLVGYADGAIWVGGLNANTTPYVDGTGDNPVTWAAAQTLSASTGLTRFRIRNGTTVTLDAATENKSLIGRNWNLALGSQSISGSYIEGATVTGIGTAASAPKFLDCQIGAATLPPAVFLRCGIGNASGTFTGGAAGSYEFIDCYSLVGSGGTPTLTFTGLGASSYIQMRRWTAGSTLTLDADCSAKIDSLGGGVHTVVTGGGNLSIRGTSKGAALTISGSGTIDLNGVFGTVTIAGTAAGGTVASNGVIGTYANTSTGATVTNNAVSLATINTEVDTALNTAIPGSPTADSINQRIAAIDDLTQASGAGDLAAVHTKLGSPVDLGGGATIAFNLSDIEAQTDDIPSAATIADAVWDETSTGHVSAGKAGTQLWTNVDAILEDTGTTLDDLVDGVESELAKVPKSDSNVTWNATALASVNAEVVDALNTDTYAEPGQGAPGATISLAAKIGYLYKSWRNKKTQTATTRSIYDDAGTTVDQKATDSDDGTTFTKGELGTGP